ncbi:MAG: hypothetical protein KF752_14195 [Pirellulaceae bacterium]|nr:hypothetical protein [Pirellulaceae bacterium]
MAIRATRSAAKLPAARATLEHRAISPQALHAVPQTAFVQCVSAQNVLTAIVNVATARCVVAFCKCMDQRTGHIFGAGYANWQTAMIILVQLV